MEEEEIELYLAALGEELARQGFTDPVRILVVGGVFMVCAMKSREATEDIDAILLDYPEMTEKPRTEAIKKFIRARNAVATTHHLTRNWLNDTARQFLFDYAPNPGEPSLWKSFGPLQIFFPQGEYVLASKLMMFRPKDYDDIEALLQAYHIETRGQAQALVDRFVPDKRWQDHYELSKNLDQLF
jgi:hypothetical protein